MAYGLVKTIALEGDLAEADTQLGQIEGGREVAAPLVVDGALRREQEEGRRPDLEVAGDDILGGGIRFVGADLDCDRLL